MLFFTCVLIMHFKARGHYIKDGKATVMFSLDFLYNLMYVNRVEWATAEKFIKNTQ